MERRLSTNYTKKGGANAPPEVDASCCGNTLYTVTIMTVLLDHLIDVFRGVMHTAVHLLHTTKHVAVEQGNDVLLVAVTLHTIIQYHITPFCHSVAMHPHYCGSAPARRRYGLRFSPGAGSQMTPVNLHCFKVAGITMETVRLTRSTSSPYVWSNQKCGTQSSVTVRSLPLRLVYSSPMVRPSASYKVPVAMVVVLMVFPLPLLCRCV